MNATSKSKINDVIEIGLDVLSGIPEVSKKIIVLVFFKEMVKNCNEHVRKIEEDFYNKEMISAAPQIDPIIIPLDGESENEGLWNEDSDDEVEDDEDVFVNVWD